MRLLQEPTSYFALIALILFGLNGLGRMNSETTLQISQQDIDARLLTAEIAQGEALTEAQRQQLTEAFIEERILVTEARKLGLDEDSRIDRILDQKMRHVLSRDVIQPSAEELSRFYEDNADRYRVPTTFDFEELVFNSRGNLPTAVVEGLSAGADAAELLRLEAGGASPLNRVSALDLRNIFSEQFSEQLVTAAPQSWQGPFISNRGQHWLLKTAEREGGLPELDEVREQLRLDWIAVEEDRRLQSAIEALRQSYAIEIVSPDAHQED